ncbi:SDR family NAD(P)-dependent oxidoreductase [Actinomadura sp. WMMA1423]|uniref:SDR family NAD(P)-dependent oxidoreductase n=1 Tax=Actinomadura sp. WMMA1423 TaxID=2591108 RepID=UPI00114703F4|nr:SDR family NAD(P)-dependent oxidoreductase [Actinomadura sp. WMMA1423]
MTGQDVGGGVARRAARKRFAGGTAVVTGGAAGIGEGFVRHLAGLGMNVVIADLDTAGAERLAGELGGGPGAVVAAHADVTDADAVSMLAQQVFARFGSVELLVNNAGLETAGPLWEIPDARWRQLMSVNVDGVFHSVRAFLPRMIELGRPAVVANMSSVGGVSSAPLQAPYIVSKHAVLALTECLHQEVALAGAPIRISAILPYSVRSSIFTSAQASAPTGHPVAARLFDAMQAANAAAGMDPVEAAAHMTDALAAGDFWVFSDDGAGIASLRARADQLAHRAPPPDPHMLLAEIEASAVPRAAGEP